MQTSFIWAKVVSKFHEHDIDHYHDHILLTTPKLHIPLLQYHTHHNIKQSIQDLKNTVRVPSDVLFKYYHTDLYEAHILFTIP